MDQQLRHFRLAEFACKCGCASDGSEMSETLLEALDSLRTLCNFPFVITSGYRCPKHPAERSKTSAGAHSGGLAVDIAVSHENALTLLRHALNGGIFTGIGINQRGSGRFIHLDIAASWEYGAPRPHIWSY